MSDRTTVHLLRHGEVHNPERRALRPPAPATTSPSSAGRWRSGSPTPWATGTSPTWSPRRSSARRRRPRRSPLARGVDIVTDARVIESTNIFEGSGSASATASSCAPSAWRHLWNPFRPSWGEPYKAVVARMMAAVYDARDAARGHEAVVVSHQLPIWTTRLHVETGPSCTTRATASARCAASRRWSSTATS